MDLQHRLKRQAIYIAISKAFEDMLKDTKRSIRNLVDLGLLFSNSENQKWFFNTAKKIISNRQNPYTKLLFKMVSNVNHETMKTVGINLGYSSLIYGAGKLKEKQSKTGTSLPWILNASASNPGLISQAGELIRQGHELGIYCYVFQTVKKELLPDLCQIAQHFDDCLFVMEVSPEAVTEQTGILLGTIHNILVSVQAENPDISSPECIKAFRVLKQNRCFYGFQAFYSDDNMKEITSPEYINAAMEQENLFGIYHAAKDASGFCQEKIYKFVCSQRGERGSSIIMLDWLRDIQNISERIFCNGGCMTLPPIEMFNTETAFQH